MTRKLTPLTRSRKIAAARALIDQPHLDAEEIGRKSMQIAADICVYTNHNFVVEVLEENPEKKD